ncbi:unnamed protein product [Heterotrigona itama]|uniref:Bromo domain-containing protein n=1 Tax=Heterotrigona itama TaxID=395501 RepID=A0A6V7GZC2_9HYME|nr:unnamed protein product [Heterotrigona itama]
MPNYRLLPPRPPSTGAHRVVTSHNITLSPYREPRTCVPRKIAERTHLERLWEHLLRPMEKRDPQQIFAWPDTNNQKIDDNSYLNLNEFVEDIKLNCDNITMYNYPDTTYYNAAMNLLLVDLIMDISKEDFDFELGTEMQIEREREKEKRNEEAEELREKNQRNLRLANSRKFEAILDDMTPKEILKRA